MLIRFEMTDGRQIWLNSDSIAAIKADDNRIGNSTIVCGGTIVSVKGTPQNIAVQIDKELKQRLVNSSPFAKE